MKRSVIILLGFSVTMLLLVWGGWLLPQPEKAFAPQKQPAKTKSQNKVLLIGLDGADWEIIQPLVREGQLPTFRRLLEEGSHGNMYSPHPLLSPIIWTTIATGKKPEKHGVFDFFEVDNKTGMNIPITSNSRAVKTLWHILSDQEKSVGVIGWRVTWPAEAVNGYIVSDRLVESEFDQKLPPKTVNENITFPDSLYNMIRYLVVSQENIGYEQFKRFVDMSEHEFLLSLQQKTRPVFPATFNIAETETFKNVFLKLQKENPTDFTAIYFKSIDWMSHLFAYYEKINASNGRFNQTIREVYIYQDEILGEILENVDDHTSVIIISDHGFKTAEKGPNKPSDFIHGYGVADWHEPEGIVIFWGNKFKKNTFIKNARPVDIAPTVLYLMDLPQAMDMEGRILQEAIQLDYFSSHPVRYVQSFENHEGAKNVEILSSPLNENVKLNEPTAHSTSASPYSFNNRGLLLMNEGKLTEAIAAFEEAIRRQGKVAAFYDNLGAAYNALGDHERAISLHQRAIDLDSNFEKAYNNLGNAYLDLNQFMEAQKAYESALTLNPGFALAYSNLGILYFKQGQFEKAEEFIKKSLELDPKSALSLYNLGVIYGEQGMPLQAIDAFKKVPEVDPYFSRMSEVYNNLGIAFFKLQRYENALQEFHKVLRLNPSFPDLYSRIGLVLLAMGKLDEAKDAFGKELVRTPNNEAVKRMINELNGSANTGK